MSVRVVPFARILVGVVSAAWLSAGCDAGARAAPAPVPDALRDQILPALPDDVPERPALGFEGKLRLVGFSLAPRDRVRAGERIDLELYWQRLEAFAPPEGPADWAPVTRLLSAAGQPLKPAPAAAKSRLLDGEAALLPRQWPLGAVIVDQQELTVPAEIEAGEVAVAVAVERAWQYERPLRARAASGAPVAADGRVTAPDVEDATMPLRLRVLGGPSVAEQAFLARLEVEGARSRRSGAPRRAGPRAE